MTPEFRAAMARTARLPVGLLLDAAREDQDRRWAAGQRVPTEDYLTALPALAANPDDAAVLVYGEVLCREAAGEAVDAAEFLRRFPQLAARLVPVFDVHRGLAGLAPAASLGTPVPPAIPGLAPLVPVSRGGMGRVYRATDTATGQPVAVKLVPVEQTPPEALVRFLQEGEILARLDHPNIVRFIRCGEREGQLFLVMEWVNGGTLAAVCGQPHDPRATAARVATLAKAVEFAHSRGIIHRDLKPANVLLSESGQPKLADFGVARLLWAGRTCTATGDVLGTAAYMAPEQAHGHPATIGPSTDVYALGAILYELLTGRTPFAGQGRGDLIGRALSEEPVSPTELVRSVPTELSAICLKCLAKEPTARFATGRELAVALHRFLGHRDG